LRTFNALKNPAVPTSVTARAVLVDSLRRALPDLVLVNGEMVALAHLVTDPSATAATTRHLWPSHRAKVGLEGLEMNVAGV
jgi:hypothetical protein